MSSNNYCDLEREYSPSMFTKRFQDCEKPNEEVLKHFLNVSLEATTLARRLYKTRLDVRYGGVHDNQLLDIYYTHQECESPIFVFIHGGFWQDLDKSTSGLLVHFLVVRSYRVLIVDYDLCPKVTLKQITKQMMNFFKWLKVYAEGTRAPKITICGHSAGAHLALQLFESDVMQPLHRLQLIDNLFLISGIYDLRDLWPLHSCNPHNILCLNAETAEELSPQFWPSAYYGLAQEDGKQNLKLHILVAENDSPSFKKQSYTYAQTLAKMKLNVNYHVFNLYDHFDIIEDCFNESSSISKYIRREMGELN